MKPSHHTQATHSFCAICADELGPRYTLQPLGKNNGMVAVCLDCSDERPVEKVGPKRDLPEAVEGGLSIREAAALRKARLAKKPKAERAPRVPIMVKDLPRDHVLHRAPIRVQGRTLDHHEALARIRQDRTKAEWAEKVIYLGSSTRYHLFARPAPPSLAQVVGQLETLAARR